MPHRLDALAAARGLRLSSLHATHPLSKPHLSSCTSAATRSRNSSLTAGGCRWRGHREKASPLASVSTHLPHPPACVPAPIQHPAAASGPAPASTHSTHRAVSASAVTPSTSRRTAATSSSSLALAAWGGVGVGVGGLGAHGSGLVESCSAGCASTHQRRSATVPSRAHCAQPAAPSRRTRPALQPCLRPATAHYARTLLESSSARACVPAASASASPRSASTSAERAASRASRAAAYAACAPSCLAFTSLISFSA